MCVRIRGKSYFYFETLPPPLRGPPPSTEGGEGCTVALNVGRGFTPAGLREESYFVFETIAPARRLATSLYTREAWVGAHLHKLERHRNPLPETSSSSGATRPKDLARCTIIVGARCARPRSWESNFTYGKSQRLLRRSLHKCRFCPFRFAALPKLRLAKAVNMKYLYITKIVFKQFY